jgi:hypothetical protein
MQNTLMRVYNIWRKKHRPSSGVTETARIRPLRRLDGLSRRAEASLF